MNTERFTDDQISSAWEQAHLANGHFDELASLALLREGFQNDETIGPEKKAYFNAAIDAMTEDRSQHFEDSSELASVVMATENSPFAASSTPSKHEQEDGYEEYKKIMFKTFDTLVPYVNTVKAAWKFAEKAEQERLEAESAEIYNQKINDSESEESAAKASASHLEKGMADARNHFLAPRDKFLEDIVSLASRAPERPAMPPIINAYLGEYENDPDKMKSARARVITTLAALYRYEDYKQMNPDSTNQPLSVDILSELYEKALSSPDEAMIPQREQVSTAPEAVAKWVYDIPTAHVERSPEDDGWIITPYTPNHDGLMPRQPFEIKDARKYAKVIFPEGLEPDEQNQAGEDSSTESSKETEPDEQNQADKDGYVPVQVVYKYLQDHAIEASETQRRQGDPAATLAEKELGFSAKSPTGPRDPHGQYVHMIPSGISQ